MVSRFREAHRTDGVKCRLQRAGSSQGGQSPQEAWRSRKVAEAGRHS